MHSGRQTEKEQAREEEREGERVGKGESAPSVVGFGGIAHRVRTPEMCSALLSSLLSISPLSLSNSISLSLSFSFSALLWLLFSLLFMLNVLNVFQLKIVATDCSGVPFLGIIDFETCNNNNNSNNITNVTNCFFVLCFLLFFFCVFFFVD